jgi:predicted acyltransferase
MPNTLNADEFNNRLLSLDFMRGLIMFLLALEGTGLYNILSKNTENIFLSSIFIQFHHHPWNGLRFWDLIQPGFMFIAGTALALSLNKMKAKGISTESIRIKIFKRSGWLFFWGVFSYAVHKEGLTFELWNVLTQLSFTLLLAYLIFEWEIKTQVISCAAILIVTELLYRYSMVPGYDEPFTNQHNFGNYVDMLLMHKTSGGGWVAINCIPTAVHTIAGAIVGKLLIGKSQNKLKTLIIWSGITLIAGYAMDFLQLTPIIKRIATSSFTLASLGWCLLGLSLCYYIIDIKGYNKKILFFTVLGMNSIFIYLFFEIVGARWFNDYITEITSGLLTIVNFPSLPGSIISCMIIFALEWGICYFLYKKKIFFRL